MPCGVSQCRGALEPRAGGLCSRSTCRLVTCWPRTIVVAAVTCASRWGAVKATPPSVPMLDRWRRPRWGTRSSRPCDSRQQRRRGQRRSPWRKWSATSQRTNSKRPVAPAAAVLSQWTAVYQRAQGNYTLTRAITSSQPTFRRREAFESLRSAVPDMEEVFQHLGARGGLRTLFVVHRRPSMERSSTSAQRTTPRQLPPQRHRPLRRRWSPRLQCPTLRPRAPRQQQPAIQASSCSYELVDLGVRMVLCVGSSRDGNGMQTRPTRRHEVEVVVVVGQ